MNISQIKTYFTHSKTNIVCLHCSASSPAQWREFASLAGDGFNVVTPDLLGYGSSENSTPETTLRDQVDHVHEVTRHLRGPIHLLGHSFGGAVALRYAIEHENRVTSLSVYESVNFRLLFGQGAPGEATDEINMMGHMVIYLVKRGKFEKAAKTFIDYWNGAGSFDAMPIAAKDRLTLRMPAVAWEFQALFRDKSGPAQYAGLKIPVQIMRGSRSPLPVRWIAKKLDSLIPNSSLLDISGLDHMGPLTRSEIVNPLIMGFIDQIPVQQSRFSKVA